MRYELRCGGQTVEYFNNLKIAKLALAHCKKNGINAYILDNETGEEILK